MSASDRSGLCTSGCAVLLLTLLLALSAPPANAQSAHIRVNQAGYESGAAPFRAYLMSPTPVTNERFRVLNSKGGVVSSSKVGALLGTWSHSKSVSYSVYALDFSAPGGDIYKIEASGMVSATSDKFAVDTPVNLYSGLLLNTLFFYETERDGSRYIPNALRTAPGHLKDESAQVYQTPPLDVNDDINNIPPVRPLVSARLPNIDASGGWWDAGDYEKYVETTSYTVALMEIGVRDFPNQMGPFARVNPPAPPVAVSFAGNSVPNPPASSDFSEEANFGIHWLMKMWNDETKTLYYQVDNTQEWNYYGYGTPTSANPNCGGTYATPYCLFTEYDIWTLPQAADNYLQPGDPEPCDLYTSYFICYRPVFLAAPAGSRISPNLAGRLAADFAVCYQVNRASNPALANKCLQNAEDIFTLADTSFPDPAPAVGAGSCSNCLLTVAPFDAYPETVWDDDMELGATEIYFALASCPDRESLPVGLAHTDPLDYLRMATQFAQDYITNVYNRGYTDTLNLYDVSGLAHYELYRALERAGNPGGLAIDQAGIRKQFLQQVADAISIGASDPFGFGYEWAYGDTTSHGAGLAVMASEAHDVTGSPSYDVYSQRWLGNILGANSWGTSFIVGDGTTFPNCIQHQVANIVGALDGTSGGTPILWGAATEGPNSYTTSGTLSGMNLCPANGIDTFKKFNGNAGPYDPNATAVFQDNVQSYVTTEPAIDLTSTSFLMWSWRQATHPAF
jgi:endoglucanase